MSTDKAPERMARARTLAGLTVAQASRYLGIGVERLTVLESGRDPADEAEFCKMADVYGAAISWLQGAPPIVPGSVTKMLREASISTHDREAIEEFAGMLGARTAKPLPSSEALAQVRARGQDPDAASVPVAAKRRYVQRQAQTRKHHCHWPGCEAQVPPAMWGCRAHWFKLPKALRDLVWRTYQPGQEVDMTPSDAYLAVADKVQEWIRENGDNR